MDRFFVIVSRINSLLFLLVLLGAAGLIAWLFQEGAQRRHRGVVEVGAAEAGADQPVQLRFGRIEAITGSQTLMMELSSLGKPAKFSSGGGGGETRNVLFLSGADKTPHWLFNDHRRVVLTFSQLREDTAPENHPTRALYVEYVSQDTNQDGLLSADDATIVGLARPDGTAVTDVLRDVQRVLAYNLADAEHLSIVYQRAGTVRHLRYSLAQAKVESDQEIVKVPTAPLN